MRDVATPAGYSRLEDAAQACQVSTKTIRNWAKQKRVGRRKVKGVVFYSEADVRLQATRQAETVPEGREVLTKQRENQDRLAALLEGMMQRMEALPRAIAPPTDPPADARPPVTEKHLLTVKEAVQLGYPRSWLRLRLKSGKLRRVGGRISRFDLEELVRPPGRGGARVASRSTRPPQVIDPVTR